MHAFEGLLSSMWNDGRRVRAVMLSVVGWVWNGTSVLLLTVGAVAVHSLSDVYKTPRGSKGDHFLTESGPPPFGRWFPLGGL